MKKNTIIYYILFLIVFNSCNEDFLDRTPLDKISSDVVWTDEGSAKAFVYNTYKGIVKNYYYMTPNDGDEIFLTDRWTDNLIFAWGTDPWIRETYTSQSSTGGADWFVFDNIRECNLIISNLQEDNGMRKSIREQLLGEGKFLRAAIYFYMVKRFGGVPIITQPLTGEDNLKLKRNSEEETYNFILKDLSDAISLLPETAEKGRINKASALIFKTRVELQAHNYDEVIKTYEQFNTLFAKKYSLEANYGDLFNNFETSFNSDEILWGYTMKEAYVSQTPIQYIVLNTTAIKGAPVSLGGWNKHQVPQELVDAYYTIDEDGVDRPWNLSKTWQNRSSLADMYKNRDNRFYASIVHDQSSYFGTTIRTNIASKWHWFNAVGYHSLKTGYLMRKYVYENDPSNSYAGTILDYHFPIIRLAEAYLNYAEALLKTGNTVEAITQINKTRNRAGLPDISETDPAKIWDIYTRERRVEFAFEDDRYWSLIRWYEHKDPSKKTIIPELNSELHGIALYYKDDVVLTDKYFGDPENINEIDEETCKIIKDTYEIKNFPIPQVWDAHKRFFSPKKYRFPIPDGEKKKNDNLNQNTGW